MANEFSTVPCAERHDTYSERLGITGWDPSVTLECKWDRRYDLVNSMYGSVWPDAPAGYFNPPRALEFTIIGEGTPNPSPTDATTQRHVYDNALVTADFSRVEQGSGAGDQPGDFLYKRESIVPKIEQARMPHALLAWGPDIDSRPLLPEEAPTIPLYREQFQITYFNIQLPLPPAFTSLQGSISSVAHTSNTLGITYAPQTLLYTHRTIETAFNTGTGASANLTLHFLFRAETWREFLDFDTQSLKEVHRWLSTTPLEWPPEADLSLIHI